MNIAYSYSQQKSSEIIAAAHAVAQRHSVSLTDYRSGSVVQRRLRDAMDSHTHTASRNVFQFKANSTGLPDNLKTGIENLSGHSMDDVKVHYHSSKPAQLNAYAYAQGNQIHVAPGQEKHLAHEAWHVVQQKQGRVRPTMQMKGKVNVNDDRGLEHEADIMGAKAMSMGFVTQRASTGRVHYHYTPVAQLRNITEINYQRGTLGWRGNNMAGPATNHQTVGISTSAFIDPEDPKHGETTSPAPAGTIYAAGGWHYQLQNNGQNLTQGHLLNANLGGVAQPFNLFPISAELNRRHSGMVEDNVKSMVLNVHQQRTAEGSLGLAPPAAAGLATGAGRAAAQVAPALELARVNALLPALTGAVNFFFGPLGGTPAAVGATMVAVAADNPTFLANRILNAAGGVAGIPPAVVSGLAGVIAAQIGGPVAAALAPLAGPAAAAPNGMAAAATFIGGIAPFGMLPGIPGLGGAPSAPGPLGTLTATPDDISEAFRAVPGGVALPAGGGAFNWDTVRVFYRVQVNNAPGVNGAGVMRPNNFRNERFLCQAYYTQQDGITPNFARPHINIPLQAPLNLNAELAALNFGPTAGAAPPGLIVGPLITPGPGAGGAGALNQPAQYSILNPAGAVVGQATLFSHT